MKKILLFLMLLCTGVFAFEAFDDFNRPNVQTLDTGNWFYPTYAGQPVLIYDSSASPREYSNSGARWRTSFMANQFCQVSVKVFTNSHFYLALHSGLTVNNNAYYLRVYKDSLKIFRNDIELVKYDVVVNNSDTIRFSSYNDSLYAHINNKQKIKIYDNTYRNGYIGIGLAAQVGKANRIDNFVGGIYNPNDWDTTAAIPAVITQQPIDTTINDLDTARFSVTATGSGLTYQWFIDDTAITGATLSNLKFFATTKYNNSLVYCQLTTDTTISSDTVTLHVNQIAPNHSGWPLEVLTWDVDKAYPGVEYNFRLGVKGGEYPYTFTLQHGPTGMTINKTTGEILWTPESATLDSVRVKITDSKGDSLIHRYNIEATTSGFYFVDSATGSNSNDGSEAQPWLTMTYASANAEVASYIYVKKGTYNETFSISATQCGRFLAYPGDTVLFTGSNAAASNIVGLSGGSKRIFQGFIFDATDHRWFFSISGYSDSIIWRKNEMRNTFDTTAENPSFVFFWDQKPRYTNMIIQDNIFHDLCDTVHHHGASVTTYAVVNSLYEDNHVYDIDGGGVNEKIGGKRNTFRSNEFNDIRIGQAIRLNANPNTDSTEICYNLIYNCTQGIILGSNGSYIANVFVHHNTCISGIIISPLVAGDSAQNINIYRNILGRGIDYPYKLQAGNGLYPANFRTKVLIDSNIVFGNIDSSDVAGSDWGVPILNWSQWQDSGKDNNSLYMQLTLDADSVPILPDSLKYEYGYLIPSGVHPAVITVQPQSITKKSGETATFSVTATGSGLTYQWYGNNTLIEGATASTYSFTASWLYNNSKIWCMLTTDTAISTDTATLTIQPVLLSASIDTLVLKVAEIGATSYQWYRNNIIIEGATTNRLIVIADSLEYRNKSSYKCLVTDGLHNVFSNEWILSIGSNGRRFFDRVGNGIQGIFRNVFGN